MSAWPLPLHDQAFHSLGTLFQKQVRPSYLAARQGPLSPTGDLHSPVGNVGNESRNSPVERHYYESYLGTAPLLQPELPKGRVSGLALAGCGASICLQGNECASVCDSGSMADIRMAAARKNLQENFRRSRRDIN